MKAIPTKYAGVQFRSRLEARWAAMFDLLGWRWEYEPIDLDGYIPDFIVRGSLLVEVKPIVEWPCPIAGCTGCDDVDRAGHDDALAKIMASGWTGDALLVGATTANRVGHMLLTGHEHPWRTGLVFCVSCRVVFPAVLLEDRKWVVSEHSSHRLESFRPEVYWREAGNRVQWRAPR